MHTVPETLEQKIAGHQQSRVVAHGKDTPTVHFVTSELRAGGAGGLAK
jgi:hypothetical protein